MPGGAVYVSAPLPFVRQMIEASRMPAERDAGPIGPRERRRS